MLAGFAPTSVTFRGSFRFSGVDELEAALAALQQLIDGEDDELATALVLRRRGSELKVSVDTICARDEYLAYETLIETLATFACSGEVSGEIDDTITHYNAVVESPLSKVVAMAWIPLLTELDLSVVLA